MTGTKTPLLFTPIKLRDVEIPNRIFLSPMCMYSAKDGLPNNWHLVHLGARAAGSFGLVMCEATAVVPEGRISPGDTGIWNDEQVEAWKPIVDFIASQGSVPAIQLAHAGRKASCAEDFVEKGRPLIVGKDERAWPVVSASSVPFSPDSPTPIEMTKEDIKAAVEAYAAAAKRALQAGFKVIELHFAHGYLIHQFLSPLSNKRTDEYGGSLEGRMRFALEVTTAVREVVPTGLPLFARISATDWASTSDGPGWDEEQSAVLSRALAAAGVDLIDVSSGGSLPKPQIPVGPGYQVPLAARIRREAGVATGAVGLITTGTQAEEVLREGSADVVFLARAALRDPNWPRRVAAELGYQGPGVHCPPQYFRARFEVPSSKF